MVFKIWLINHLKPTELWRMNFIIGSYNIHCPADFSIKNSLKVYIQFLWIITYSIPFISKVSWSEIFWLKGHIMQNGGTQLSSHFMQSALFLFLGMLKVHLKQISAMNSWIHWVTIWFNIQNKSSFIENNFTWCKKKRNN